MPKHLKVIFCFLWAAALILTGCTTASSTPLALSTVTPTRTSTETPPPQPTLTGTYTPTATATSSPSPIPTQTPTPVLPVELATPLPVGQLPITKENASQLRLLAYWGLPQMRTFTITQDGRRGFVATNRGVTLYDTASGEILEQYAPVIRVPAVDSFSASATGERFAIITDQDVQVWSQVGDLMLSVPVPAHWPWERLAKIRISPDGKTLALRGCENPDDCMNSPHAITLYDLETGQKIAGQPDLGSDFRFEFSPDSRWFVTWTFSSSTKNGSIWETYSWNKVRDIPIAPNTTVAGFSPDGDWIVLQNDQLVQFYQVEEWKLLRQISVALQNTTSDSKVVFSPDGSKIAIRGDRDLTVWDLSSGELLGEHSLLDQPWALSDDGIPFQWQIPTQVSQSLNLQHIGDFMGEAKLAYDPDGQRILAVIPYGYWWEDGFYQACSLPLGSPPTCQESRDPLLAHRDSVFYAIRAAGESEIYEVVPAFDDSAAPIGSLGRFGSPIWISNDNQFGLFTTTEPSSELWNLSKGALVERWPPGVYQVGVHQNGNILVLTLEKYCGTHTCGSDLVVYDLVAESDLFSLQTPSVYTHWDALTFSPDGKLFYSLGDNNNDSVSFFVWDPDTRKSTALDFSLIIPDHWYFEALAFSPDGELLALGLPDGTIHLFDAQSFDEVFSWQAHQGRIHYIQFTPDRTSIFSSALDRDGDGYLRLWGILP